MQGVHLGPLNAARRQSQQLKHVLLRQAHSRRQCSILVNHHCYVSECTCKQHKRLAPIFLILIQSKRSFNLQVNLLPLYVCTLTCMSAL